MRHHSRSQSPYSNLSNLKIQQVNIRFRFSSAAFGRNRRYRLRASEIWCKSEMSVLNQSGEEQVECPLCMEPLEVDDLNFFPCTCGYQICRFCWHRIRTDENGLCPACRKAYSEDPADFTPLSREQVAKLKAAKRQRDQQRKAKLSESRKHLASVRVVQRNLVFVVGLPMRLADAEVLKRHEYFGKFGKIHKVVINQSTAYAGSQGPSASAYVTYMKSDDALRAIQSVNNVTIDGRLIKSSLGTTKYCSHFMKNQPCPKPDCMYLHDFGDAEASFTKEQMHAGKHQEYEKKLHDALLQRNNNSSNSNNNTGTSSGTNITAVVAATTVTTTTTTSSSANVAVTTVSSEQTAKARSSKEASTTTTSTSPTATTATNGTNKENWPQLNTDGNGKKQEKTDSKDKAKGKSGRAAKEKKERKTEACPTKKEGGDERPVDKLSILDDNSSFFTHHAFQKIVLQTREELNSSPSQPSPSLLTDTLPDVGTTEDWAAVFGFDKSDADESCTSPIIRSIFPELIDVLTTNKTNGYAPIKTQPPHDSYFGKESGLERHMSKFFVDFHTKQQQTTTTIPTTNHHHGSGGAVVNGFGGGHVNYFENTDRLMLLKQKKLEEHLMNLSLKQHTNNHNNHHASYGQYVNGDQQHNGYGGYHQVAQQQRQQQPEDELGFDPFQETQKALAELIANEQNGYKTHASANNVRHGPSLKNHLSPPPPPPGFVQPTSNHMNSFGSKFLPYLNMSNNQQQQQAATTTQNWPSYSAQPQQQQHKNMNGCNDWKEFDSAIVTTSRHYPLMSTPMNNPFRSQPQQPVSRSAHDYGSAFSNFTQQLQQPNYTSYTSHLNQASAAATTTPQPQPTPNLSWFHTEFNTQISSPPGFRSTNQTSKQQEC